MFRLLITGSRIWEDEDEIRENLTLLYDEYGKDVVLVSGHCPTGADAMCEKVAIELGWAIELHPADWGKHGRSAGFIRNDYMVSLGADRCMAFIRENSKGASHTAKKAKEAGIRTDTFIF